MRNSGVWDWPGNSCRDESLNEASCLRLTFQEEVEELTVRVLHSLCFYPDSCLSFFILQNPTKVRFVLRSWRRRCESHGLCTVQYIITQRCLNDNVTDCHSKQRNHSTGLWYLTLAGHSLRRINKCITQW